MTSQRSPSEVVCWELIPGVSQRFPGSYNPGFDPEPRRYVFVLSHLLTRWTNRRISSRQLRQLPPTAISCCPLRPRRTHPPLPPTHPPLPPTHPPLTLRPH